MKNVKQFEDFLNEDFFTRKTNFDREEDDDIAEQILDFIKENPNIIKENKKNQSYSFKWKDSYIVINNEYSGKSPSAEVIVDDEILDISWSIRVKILEACENIEIEEENKNKEKKKLSKREKLAKFREKGKSWREI